MPLDLDSLSRHYEDLLLSHYGYVDVDIRGLCREDLMMDDLCAKDLWKAFGRVWVSLARVPTDHEPDEPDLERYRSYLVDRLSDQVGFSGTTLPGDNFPQVYASYAAVFANMAS